MVVVVKRHAVFPKLFADFLRFVDKAAHRLVAASPLVGCGTDAHGVTADQLMLGDHGVQVRFHTVERFVGHTDLHAVRFERRRLLLGRKVADAGNLHVRHAQIVQSGKGRIKRLCRADVVTQGVQLDAHGGFYHVKHSLKHYFFCIIAHSFSAFNDTEEIFFAALLTGELFFTIL